ncbi:MAG: hypothetical protein SOX31_10035 [Eubacteriales bacterium]|nr:hypothetical protein [Eubacteriales bacterium]
MEFHPTGITAKDYLAVMERVVDAYGVPYFEAQLSLPDDIYLSTAYRTSCMLAVMVSSGRRPELFELWLWVTEKAHRCFAASENSAYNDLALKELLLSRILMRDRTPEAYAAVWDGILRSYDFDRHYAQREGRFNNMAVYGLVGAYLLEKMGLCNSETQFDRVMPWVLGRMDENGMFDDIDDAMLYDLSARVQLEQLLWLGYDGKYAGALEDNLVRAAELSLRMQSAAYQIPFGGRSNQYLHNEALFASLGEFEAARWARRGDMTRAGRFKRAAHLSVTTVSRYLDAPGGAKHVKNFFEPDSLFGLDNYGTFPRYMNCLAIFLNYGYLCATHPDGLFSPAAAEPEIPELPAPSETGGFVRETSPCFGKVFAAAGGYSVELALDADSRYDAPGLGRIHKCGVPAELGLSVPFAGEPGYLLTRMRIPFGEIGPEPVSVYLKKHPEANRVLEELREPSESLSICTGWTGSGGRPRFLCEFAGKLHSEVRVLRETPDDVRFSVRWTGMERGIAVEEDYTLTPSGVTLRAKVSGANAWVCVPVLEDNGREKTGMEWGSRTVSACLAGCRYTVSSSGTLRDHEKRLANRSGLYRRAVFGAEGPEIELRMTLGKAN